MKRVFLSGPFDAREDLSLLTDALLAEGIDVVSVDRLPPSRPTSDFTEAVLSGIKRCDIFVALVFKTYPNVMFELGYALGAGRSVLLITSSNGKIPFDVANLPVLMIDSFDRRSTSMAVAWIKDATVKPRRASRQFENAQEMLQGMCDDESFLDELEPRAFESCIASVLHEKGFDARQVDAPHERGFDFEIRDLFPNDLTVVEAKKLNRNSRVSVSEVQRVVGAAVTAGAGRAIIITSGRFTSSAQFFANESPIRVVLLTIDELSSLTREEIVRLSA